MVVVEISKPGPPEVLVAAERPVPAFGPDDVLIKVAAAGVNRPDIMQRLGKYPPPPGASDIPGLEVSGLVAEVGANVRGWRQGDAVCALVSGGGYAEYCAAPAPQCLPPPNVSLIDAAGVPETTFTVYTNLIERGRLAAGETVLIHGGSSGIGTTAIQLARAVGARVLTTAGSADKCAQCEALGAEHAINYREHDFVAAVKDLTGGRGVNLVIDMVGGEYLQRNLEVLMMDGRLVQIGQLGGPKAQINMIPVLQRRLTITGSVLRPRSVAEKGAIAAAVHRHVWPLYATGAMRVIVHATYPLREAAEAHRVMEASTHVGKLILVV